MEKWENNVFYLYCIYEIMEQNDFDDLVKKVNVGLSTSPEIVPVLSITKKFLIALLWESIPTQPLLDKDLFDITGLTPYQIDAINSASDRVRAFEKTKQQFEQEKCNKDPERVRILEESMQEAEELYRTVYDMYKKKFYVKTDL